MAFQITDNKVSQRLVKLLVDEPTTFVYCLDMRTQRFVYASRAAKRLMGRKPDELCAPDAPLASEFLAEPDGEHAGEQTHGRVLRIRHEDGKSRWLQTREVVLETDAFGRVTLLLGFGRDVTRRREDASDLGLHKYLLRTLNRIVEQFSVLPGDEDVTTSISDALKVLGPIVGAARCQLCCIHDRNQLPVKLSVTHEFCLASLPPMRKSMQHLPVNLFPWFFEQITAGKEVFLDEQRRLPRSDRVMSALLAGASADSYVAIPLVDGAEVWGYMGLAPSNDDSKVWDDDVLSLLKLAGQVFVNRIMYRDVTHALIESELKWRQTADAAFDLVLILNKESTVVDASSQREDIDETSFIGANVFQLIDTSSYRKLRTAIDNALRATSIADGAQDIEVEAPGPNAGLIWYRVRVSPRLRGDQVLGVNLFGTVIQEQKESAARISELSRELEQASRLSVLGQMATEIAHELNQPLQVIASYTEGLRLKLKALGLDEELLDVTDRVISAAGDAAQTVKNIREFVHHRIVEVNFVSIEEVVQSTLLLAEPIIREHDVVVQTDVEPSLPDVLINPAQINHVLLNLIINGIEAAVGEVLMQQIAIRIKCWLDEDSNRVKVSVTDNGPGVPKQQRESIFKRYVTTKKNGLGVGLASSRDVIQRYGGQLIIEDMLPTGRRGARFVFSLPLAGSVEAIESDTVDR